MRVSKVVGDGNVWQRAAIVGAEGAWEGCVQSVNSLISNMYRPTFELSQVRTSFMHSCNGFIGTRCCCQRRLLSGMKYTVFSCAYQPLSFQVDLLEGFPGEYQHIAHNAGSMINNIKHIISEVARVVGEVKDEGKLGSKVEAVGSGAWKDLTVDVNTLMDILTEEVWSAR